MQHQFAKLLAKLLLLVLLTAVGANVDVYIKANELNRTIGMAKPIIYVRSGNVNKYALQFPFLIKSHIEHMRLWWKTNSSTPIDYSITVDVDDPTAVDAHPNVAPVGTIPTNEAVLPITLACTGILDGEFIVRIDINYTYPSRLQPSHIRLIRRKICTNDKPYEQAMLSPQRSVPIPHEATQQQRHASIGRMHPRPKILDKTAHLEMSTSSNYIFYIAIGVVLSIISLVSLFIVVYFIRAKRFLQFNEEKNEENSIVKPTKDWRHEHYLNAIQKTNESEEQPFLYHQRPMSENSKFSNARQSSGIYSQVRIQSTRAPYPSPMPSSYATESRQESLIDQMMGSTQDGTFFTDVRRLTEREQTVLVKKLTEEIHHGDDTVNEVVEVQGAFGSILHCQRTPGSSTATLCKSLASIRMSQSQISKSYTDALNLQLAPGSDNLCRIVSIEKLKDRVRFVYNVHDCVNLKRYLLHTRGEGLGPLQAPSWTNASLTTGKLVELSLQATLALQHLHDHNILHGDVAARNCVLTNTLNLKLCDSALSADMFHTDYDCLLDGTNRPVRWLAVEMLAGSENESSASDVWSLGILLWEMITSARHPYDDVDVENMFDFLDAGYRLNQPANCPQQLYSIMLACWAPERESRPSAEICGQALQMFIKQLATFV